LRVSSNRVGVTALNLEPGGAPAGTLVGGDGGGGAVPDGPAPGGVVPAGPVPDVAGGEPAPAATVSWYTPSEA